MLLSDLSCVNPSLLKGVENHLAGFEAQICKDFPGFMRSEC